jgi:hypothetical protein
MMIRKEKTHAVIGLHTEELSTKILDLYDFAVGKFLHAFGGTRETLAR